MVRRLLFVALVVGALALLPSSAAAAGGPFTASPTVLQPVKGLTGGCRYGAKTVCDANPVATAVPGQSGLWDIPLHSDAVDDRATSLGHNGVRVLLPDSYTTNTAKRYPVVYALLGMGGWTYRCMTWSSALKPGGGYNLDNGSCMSETAPERTDVGPGPLKQLIGSRDVIVVMPDAGKNSWYTNWAVRSTVGVQNWETYYLDQLVPWVDANFRTLGTPRGRAIIGYSMGGFGAMHLATAGTHQFGVAASMSGAVDIEDPLIGGVTLLSSALMGLQDGASALMGLGPFASPYLSFLYPTRTFAHQNPMRNLGNLRPDAKKGANFTTKVYLSSTVHWTPGKIGVPDHMPTLDEFTAAASGAVMGALANGIEGGVGEATFRMDLGFPTDMRGTTEHYTNFTPVGRYDISGKPTSDNSKVIGNCVGWHGGDCMVYQLTQQLPKVLAELDPAT